MAIIGLTHVLSERESEELPQILDSRIKPMLYDNIKRGVPDDLIRLESSKDEFIGGVRFRLDTIVLHPGNFNQAMHMLKSKLARADQSERLLLTEIISLLS